jgi:hypothetical protein
MIEEEFVYRFMVRLRWCLTVGPYEMRELRLRFLKLVLPDRPTLVPRSDSIWHGAKYAGWPGTCPCFLSLNPYHPQSLAEGAIFCYKQVYRLCLNDLSHLSSLHLINPTRELDPFLNSLGL